MIHPRGQVVPPFGRIEPGSQITSANPDVAGNSLESLVLESIDETLADLLGRRAREAIYDHLERNHLIGRSEIPKVLDEFISVLETAFGKGSKTIGKSIAKRLYAKLGWEFAEVPNFALGDYVGMIKARLDR